MNPYYSNELVEIYHADCMDVLPELEPVSLVLTDPPYGINRSGQKESICKNNKHNHKEYEDFGWDNDRPDKELFNKIIECSNVQIIWGGNYFSDILPRGDKWLVWDKGQRISQSDCELAYTSMTGALRVFTLNRVAIMQDGAVHPTQKPLSLMVWCIEQSKTTGIILDPFGGSCTTAVASMQLNRHCIIIETEERYCEVGAKRCEHYKTGLTPAEQDQGQQTLFGE